MKRLIIVSLWLLLLLILIPGCVTVQAKVQPSVIGNFSSNPSTISPGASSNLVWNVTGANSVSIDQGIGLVGAAGVRAISPAASTVYTLTATNSTGTVTRTAVTTVSSGPGTGILVGIIPGESGSLIKNVQDYTKSQAVCVGDTANNLASRAFLSFDISAIPANAIIDDVSLNIGGYTSAGNATYTDPVNGPQYGNFGALSIERYQYGTYADLDTYAYNRAGEVVASGEITSFPLSPWILAIKDPASGAASVQGLIIAGQPRFQLKAQFFTSTNWNGVQDMLCFDQAKLTVKYHLP